MPITPTYPGVYVEEIKSGVHTITGVATSIAAFIGSADRGPDNDPTTINSFGDYERTFGGLSINRTLGFAVRDFFLNGGSQAIIVRLANLTPPAPPPAPPPAAPPAAPPAGGGAAPAAPAAPAPPPPAARATIDLPTGVAAPNDFLNLTAASAGVWGANLSVTVDANTKDKTNKSLFNLTVSELDGAGNKLQSETFLNVSVQSGDARFVPRVLKDGSSLIQVKRNAADTDWIVPNVAPSSGTVKAKGGADGGSLKDADYLGDQAKKTGIFALEKADLFNMLCLAPEDQDISTAVVAAAASYCEKRRAMLLVDPPSTWINKTAAVAGAQDLQANVGTNSANAAIFFPRLKELNPLRDGQIDQFVPCGAVAGVFARTDGQRGVWKAPAGIDATLVGVPQLTVPITDAENGELNPLGVNCLRAFPVIGRVVWGARTMRGADILTDDYKYVPVRRLALFLEESLYRGTKWVVFEPNDEPLWAQIRLNVGAFMHNLFRQGAFQGTTPAAAYFVKCDKETTTQNDINLGIVNIIVGYAPLKPAEFVFIKIQQIAGQIDV